MRVTKNKGRKKLVLRQVVGWVVVITLAVAFLWCCKLGLVPHDYN